MILLTALLALHVVLDEATPLRLASTGTGSDAVEWSLGDDVIAQTTDESAQVVVVPAGANILWASSAATGEWQVMARAAADGNGEARYVPAWTAVHPADATPRSNWLPGALALGALLVAFGRRRSLLQSSDPAPRVED